MKLIIFVFGLLLIITTGCAHRSSHLIPPPENSSELVGLWVGFDQGETYALNLKDNDLGVFVDLYDANPKMTDVVPLKWKLNKNEIVVSKVNQDEPPPFFRVFGGLHGNKLLLKITGKDYKRTVVLSRAVDLDARIGIIKRLSTID